MLIETVTPEIKYNAPLPVTFAVSPVAVKVICEPVKWFDPRKPVAVVVSVNTTVAAAAPSAIDDNRRQIRNGLLIALVPQIPRVPEGAFTSNPKPQP
jgi:hypothetical protein